MGSKAPLPYQIASGVDRNGDKALAFGKGITEYTVDGDLKPVRIELNGLDPNALYDIYYVISLNIPGTLELFPTTVMKIGRSAHTNPNDANWSEILSFGILFFLQLLTL